jgi:adenylate cyclase
MEPGVTKAGKGLRGKVKGKRALVLGILAAFVGVAAVVVLWQFYLPPAPPPHEVASKEKMAFPLPSKPSIGVLSFTNMSGDPKEDFFGDGIAEEIITALSKSPKLFVIARNSTFVYKGKPVSIKQVAEELGVQYVLEGSFRKTDDKVRITAQLIDALSGHHLWAERYDRDLKDIFAVQDEITVKITSALNVKLTDGEIALMLGRSTKNLEAYLKLIQAREFMLQGNKENIALSRRLTEEAISLDPQCAMAYGLMASIYTYDVNLSTSQSPGESIAKGIEMAQKSIALDKNLAWPHGTLVYLYVLKKDYDKALTEGEIALALEPNAALSYMFLGQGLFFSSRYDEAIAAYEKAIRLSPFPPSAVLFGLGSALQSVGRYEEAVAVFKKLLQKWPDNIQGRVALSATYSMMGRDAEARVQAKEILRIDPNFSLDTFSKRPLSVKNKADQDGYIDALRKAGLK